MDGLIECQADLLVYSKGSSRSMTIDIRVERLV